LGGKTKTSQTIVKEQKPHDSPLKGPGEKRTLLKQRTNSWTEEETRPRKWNLAKASYVCQIGFGLQGVGGGRGWRKGDRNDIKKLKKKHAELKGKS